MNHEENHLRHRNARIGIQLGAGSVNKTRGSERHKAIGRQVPSRSGGYGDRKRNDRSPI
jgi:hypothetical protein